MNPYFRNFAALLALALCAPALAGSIGTPISTATCQPYYTGFATSPAILQFRPDGIFNKSQTAQHVICPLPKGDDPWTPEYKRQVNIYFEAMDLSPIYGMAYNVCTLYLGADNMNGKSLAAKPYLEFGQVTFNETTGPHGYAYDAATMVCVIAPRYALKYLYLKEG